ncbi:hypothetical protein HDU76_003847 [Blyttiomyces sp. JEL0837]|nr:hypothetical protein HDU76_003847 [Blyttiomyces sp. JEL0837]
MESDSNAFLAEFVKTTLLSDNGVLTEACGSIFDKVKADPAKLSGNLFSLFGSVMEARGDSMAILTESGEDQVTFKELGNAVNILANELKATLPTTDDSTLERPKVLILMAPSTLFFACAIAIVKAGGCLVLLDPTMESAKLKHCLEVASPTTIITNMSGAKWTAATTLYPSIKQIQHVLRVDNSSLKGKIVDEFPTVNVDGSADLLMTFTTGSTGPPKKVVKSHNFIKAQLYTIAELTLFRRIIPGKPKPKSKTLPGQVAFTNLPTFILGFLSYGCTVLLPTTFNIQSQNPTSLTAAIEKNKTTMMIASPSCALRLANHVLKQKKKLDLRHCLVGGAPVFKHELESLIEAVSGTVWVVYGSSEAEPMAMVSAEDRLLFEKSNMEDGAAANGGLVSFAICGGYVDWVESSTVRIAPLKDSNSDQQFLVEPNMVGEIVVCGPQVHTIDYNRMIKDETTGALFLRTGDAGFLDKSNRLWLLGRVEWSYANQANQRPIPESVRPGAEGAAAGPLFHYWSTSVERILLDRFGPEITYAVYLKHEGRAKLFIEAPQGCGADKRREIINLMAEFQAPVHELHVKRSIPRDRRHGSKPNTFMLFKSLLRRRKPDEVVKGEKKSEAGSLSRIGESLRRGIAVLEGEDEPVTPTTPTTQSSQDEYPTTEVIQDDATDDKFSGSIMAPHDATLPLVLFSDAPIDLFTKYGGGKACNLAKLAQLISNIAEKRPGSNAAVPDFFCVATGSLATFLLHNGLQSQSVPPASITSMPSGSDREEALQVFFDGFAPKLYDAPFPPELANALNRVLGDGFVEPHEFLAVRSSGADEDASDHSFAGQFESFMYVPPTYKDVEMAIKKCWASAFAPRVMAHRLDCGMPVDKVGKGMAVVVQLMVHSVSAGVAFSRHPLKPVSHNTVLIEGVWGQGEGLVGGLVEPDGFEAYRDGAEKGKVVERTVVDKPVKLDRNTAGGETGLVQVEVPIELQKVPCLTDDQCAEIAHVAVQLELALGGPQDMEWAYGPGVSGLRCVQVRPIVTLPKGPFFAGETAPQGSEPILWDNSNIVESYSGVTTPLTFSFASEVYGHVYRYMLRSMQVPEDVIEANKTALENTLGLIRGNVYYNLMNWYKMLSLIPLNQFGDPKFMETMMGVKQGADQLSGDVKEAFARIHKERPNYAFTRSLTVQMQTLVHFRRIDTIVEEFFAKFNPIYEKSRKIDFSKMPLSEQVAYFRYLEVEIMQQWNAPLINDLLVMSLFGTLKKMTAKHIIKSKPNSKSTDGPQLNVEGLQNDLLCGQGDVESAEPTKLLMKIAKEIDSDEDLREWFRSATDSVVASLQRITLDKENAGAATLNYEAHRLASESAEKTSIRPEEIQRVLSKFMMFLDRFGFRCVNELKLEEPDLHDNPSFVVEAVAGYVKTKAYNIEDMEERERIIRERAEGIVKEHLRGSKLTMYLWVLKHTRKVVKHRENLRFARTKVFGVVRHLVRGMGHNLKALGYLDDERDVFYLTHQELIAFADGRAVTMTLKETVALRKEEFEGYRNSAPPPERFITRGAAGAWMNHVQVLQDMDLLKDMDVDPDPNVLKGVSCCPGSVTGTVRVVTDLSQTRGIDNEILVTARTDPGWVPIYPLCSGLLIERGSLLSHSAVVARELGLPTIVGISGGLMKRLKTGMKVHVDATKGIVRILDDEGKEIPVEEGSKADSDETTA